MQRDKLTLPTFVLTRVMQPANMKLVTFTMYSS